MKHIEVAVLFYTLGIISFAGCAAMQYHYYGIDLPSECYDKGNMLGKPGSKGWPNLSFDECKPDAAVKAKCVLELSADHFAKERELQQLRKALAECQAGPHP